jgi:hypothetical protein
MHKQEGENSNRDLLNPLDYDENNVSAQEKQKQNRLQRKLQAQMNRTNGRSPNKKYGY